MGASSRQQHPELIQISTAARSDTNVQTLELQSVEPTHAYRLAPRSRAKLALQPARCLHCCVWSESSSSYD